MNDMKLLGIKEAAAYLHISTRTATLYARTGRIKGVKVARAWMFTPDALERFVRGDKESTPRPADALAVFVPGLSNELRAAQVALYRSELEPARTKLDEILRDYIRPMELIATGKE